jgi:hypothetical protein
VRFKGFSDRNTKISSKFSVRVTKRQEKLTNFVERLYEKWSWGGDPLL